MLLVGEVLLAVWAWRRGWGWLALLPVAIASVSGLVVGMVDGIDLMGAGLILDLITIGVLVAMVVRPRGTAWTGG